ncbi:uncharacterized protein LOC141905697 [Tubulanus polymorphus]|uniref:uncharacterized protein LOC141905697 n=1 Tax=Tubulanus polymorphus TaxID=672921 RepID=UPI003DA2ECAE
MFTLTTNMAEPRYVQVLDDGYGVTHFMAGKQNKDSPSPYKTSRDGMSHLWRGPAFYTRELRRYTTLDETLNPATLPQDVSAMATRNPSRSVTKVPGAIQAMSAGDAWNRNWSGSGFYSPQNHVWTREMVNIGIPSDSRLMINEEDWLKYKFMCGHPTMKPVPTGSNTSSRTATPTSAPGRQLTKPIIYDEHLKYYMS